MRQIVPPVSSAMDLVFYEGEQFPPEYKGSAFVALKGSWNRSQPTGYKVVRVPFKDGRPENYYENFVTGFWISSEQRAEVWDARLRLPSPRTVRCSRRRYRRHDLAHRLYRQEPGCCRTGAKRRQSVGCGT